MGTYANPPIPHADLEKYAQSACETVIGPNATYDFESCDEWNRQIIQAILQDIVKADEPNSKRYKFAVTSTIIQHLEPVAGDSAAAAQNGTNGSTGKRGMHSATGAFWNNATDGIWTWKWDAADSRGCDAVISITYVAA